MAEKNEIEVRKKPAPNHLLVGALIGTGAGLFAAMLIQRRAKKQARETLLSVPEAIQLTLLLFGLFRAITALGDDKK